MGVESGLSVSERMTAVVVVVWSGAGGGAGWSEDSRADATETPGEKDGAAGGETTAGAAGGEGFPGRAAALPSGEGAPGRGEAPAVTAGAGPVAGVSRFPGTGGTEETVALAAATTGGTGAGG
jgi:hypothetical protein